MTRTGENGTRLAFTFAAVIVATLLAIAVSALLVRRDAPETPRVNDAKESRGCARGR